MRQPNRIRCPECNKGNAVEPIMCELDLDWKPDDGYDPRMRLYRCPKGHLVYHTMGEREYQNFLEYAEYRKA